MNDSEKSKETQKVTEFTEEFAKVVGNHSVVHPPDPNLCFTVGEWSL
jgi:hypothetical protein